MPEFLVRRPPSTANVVVNLLPTLAANIDENSNNVTAHQCRGFQPEAHSLHLSAQLCFVHTTRVDDYWSTRRSTRVDQYRCQSLARRGSGAKTVLRGHIASGTLGNTLATAPPRGPIFLVGARPHDPPPLSLALRLTRVDARNVNKALHLSALVTSAVPATLVLSFR